PSPGRTEDWAHDDSANTPGPVNTHTQILRCTNVAVGRQGMRPDDDVPTQSSSSGGVSPARETRLVTTHLLGTSDTGTVLCSSTNPVYRVLEPRRRRRPSQDCAATKAVTAAAGGWLPNSARGQCTCPNQLRGTTRRTENDS